MTKIFAVHLQASGDEDIQKPEEELRETRLVWDIIGI